MANRTSPIAGDARRTWERTVVSHRVMRVGSRYVGTPREMVRREVHGEKSSRDSSGCTTVAVASRVNKRLRCVHKTGNAKRDVL